MPKYRKKPVEIEARQVPIFTDPYVLPQRVYDLAEWCGGYEGYSFEEGYWFIDIPTLEGIMRANPRDYIICGVQGEYYPCKPDIFDATYEEVE